VTVPISPDGKGLPNSDRCASCKSACTKIHQVDTYGLPPKPIYICVDRELCRTIMIMDHMITNVRSA
jgi:hypothetical protein